MGYLHITTELHLHIPTCKKSLATKDKTKKRKTKTSENIGKDKLRKLYFHLHANELYIYL